jgi:hypothetical protein
MNGMLPFMLGISLASFEVFSELREDRNEQTI